MQTSGEELGRMMYESCNEWSRHLFQPDSPYTTSTKYSPLKIEEVSFQEITLVFIWILYLQLSWQLSCNNLRYCGTNFSWT